MKTITLQMIRDAFSKKRYQWFDFHLIGIRKANGNVNQWDDVIGYVWGDLVYLVQGTTDPGLDYLLKPMNRAGTGIMAEGQYVNAYQFGNHQNNPQHPAFVQVGPVRFFRDNDRDAVHDLDPKTLTSGIVGANIHRANINSDAALVGPHSAMCQVVRRFKSFEKILADARKSGRTRFTYTLLNEADL